MARGSSSQAACAGAEAVEHEAVIGLGLVARGVLVPSLGGRRDLVEARETSTLLAGAIAKLDQQKNEWARRTAEKELSLRDQAKKLTEAWLEVEDQRRQKLQTARTTVTTGQPPLVVKNVSANVVSTTSSVISPSNAAISARSLAAVVLARNAGFKRAA